MIISEYLKQIFVCPSCQTDLQIREDGIYCGSCGKVGDSQSGVLNFLPPGREERQHAFYNDEEYKKGFNKINEMYSIHNSSNSLSSRLENYFKDELLKIVVNPQRPFFDIGCGMGAGFKHLGYPEPVVGIDISFNLLKICKENHPKADCICCDITHPPLKDNSLKTVFSIASLEHIFYLENFLSSIDNLLSHDGYFYVLIPTEGGFAWNMIRNFAHFKYSRAFNINYKKLFEKEHCNKATTIDNVLNKFFKAEETVDIPWRFGGNNLNFVKLYRLRKRT